MKANFFDVLFFMIINVIIEIKSSENDYKKENTRTRLLIISMDGTRADKLNKFFDKNPDAAIKKYFVENGVKAEYMQPGYPSNTFPSHFTISTGKFTENHGIIGLLK
jgi:predicted AlkP superfamily pyrophosphatase or phosphodiesterase